MAKEKRKDVPYPNLGGIKVYIEGGGLRDYIRMFARAGCKHAFKPSEADLVVFTGGADINPAVYGDKQNFEHTKSFNKERDVECEVLFNFCTNNKIPMFGICRGMQFLHAMHGGKLWQHVDNHAGKVHNIVDENTGEVVAASSFHHQMCRNHEDNYQIFPIAYAETALSNRYIGSNYQLIPGAGDDFNYKELEAAIYISAKEEVLSLGVQGHPEWGPEPYTHWCLSQLQNILYETSIKRANLSSKSLGHNKPPKLLPNYTASSTKEE